jgi:hypothetical protein
MQEKEKEGQRCCCAPPWRWMEKTELRRAGAWSVLGERGRRKKRKNKERRETMSMGKAWNLFVRARDKDGSVGEIRLKLCLSFIGERG